jgi:hypothetical protein
MGCPSRSESRIFEIHRRCLCRGRPVVSFSTATNVQPLMNYYISRTTSYEYSLLYVRSLPPSSQAGQTAAIEAISLALRLPTIFNFDPLFKLDTVLALKNHELFSLLLIFLNNGLPEYQAWEKSHPGALEKYRASRISLW